MERRVFNVVVLMLFGLIVAAGSASAQSAIAGLVRDQSGAVLPGVTIEATSPVLIEGAHSAVTDDQGRYRVVDLRPGVYKVTFTLTGFGTVVREGVELPSEFVATVNVDLKVASLAETVTVSGASPLVDVQQVSKTQVLTREIIDSLPTTRNVMSVGILVPGIRFGTPDIGGSRAMEQPAMRTHGVNQRETVQMVDGMQVNSNEDCVCMGYFDDALQAEASITTSALPPDNAGGGIRVNSIPKDGGNLFSGNIFLGGTDGTWQANNVDAYLRSRNIQSANGIAHIQNFNGASGGPIVRDRLWYFGSARYQSTNETVANVPQKFTAPDGEEIQGILDQFVNDVALRLTGQIGSRHKLSAFMQRIWKYKGKDFTFGQDPRASTQRDPNHAHYAIGTIKWTSTFSSRLLFEGGFSTSYQHWTGGNQPGRAKTRGTPEWYAFAQRTDTALNINPDCSFTFGCTSWMSVQDQRTEATRRVYQASLSYVTGTHTMRVGIQDSTGPSDIYTTRNGDLIEQYSNNKPSTVQVFNTPSISKAYVNYDLGLYAQDAWTLKRLTISPGVRVAWFNSSMKEVSMEAGRFAPARFFNEQTNLPNWGPDVAPRVGAAYDLFGNGKTALKASLSKYYVQYTGSWARRYANSVVSSDTRNWFDCAFLPGTSTCDPAKAGLATNGDGIAQDNEIGPTSSTTFGLRSDRNPAPDIKRVHNWEYTMGVQHQLLPRVSASLIYYHRVWGDLEILDHTLVNRSDYASFQVAMPSFANDPTLSGVMDPNETLTLYNLNASKRSVYSSAQVDRNSSSDSATYNAVETSFSARLPRGINAFGGWTAERNVSNFCESDDDPNGINTADLYIGENVSTGGRFCNQGAFGVPFRHEFKAAGNVPLFYGLEFGTILQSYPGQQRIITWTPGAGVFPNGQRTNSETIILSKPGSTYQPRWSQWDINLKRNFRYGRKVLTAQVDVFNILNSNTIWSTNDQIGNSLGQVQTIQPGRMPRIVFQMRW
jgi:carboxypeptidase family protein